MIERFDRLYVRANRVLVGALMIAMFGLVFTNVVTRYGFGFSLSWVEEIARFLMIWVTFLGAGLALREGRHVAIELLQDRLPERARRGLRLVLAALILIFVAFLVVYGAVFAIPYLLDDQAEAWTVADGPFGGVRNFTNSVRPVQSPEDMA